MTPRMPSESVMPSVTVVHSLPGRVRMRLSQAPSDAPALASFLREHDGMGAIGYTPTTGSLLVRFNPHLVSVEEITLRTAFRYAIDQGPTPVRLLATPGQVALQNSAVVSGVTVLAALALQGVRPARESTSAAPWLAGLVTAYSVMEHGWREFRTRGYFDPEVLVLAYLAAALIRGNVLTASLVTWSATFGRHLVETPSTGVVVEPVAVGDVAGDAPRYELVIAPDTRNSGRLRTGVIEFLNRALRYAMTGGGAHGLRSFWEELQDVSAMHGEVLEGVGRDAAGIPIRFRRAGRNW